MINHQFFNVPAFRAKFIDSRGIAIPVPRFAVTFITFIFLSLAFFFALS